ncbi:hypothetical protein RyT2_14260 [Pseudolactococcus yaeyamensis]
MSTNRGLENLKLAVKNDQEESPNIHDYQGKLDWIIERAKHYGSSKHGDRLLRQKKE